MNSLVKMFVSTGCNNNTKTLLLRLYHNADRARNFNNISKKTLNKIINTHKIESNRIINIRAYGSQIYKENMLSVEEDNDSDKSHFSVENRHCRQLFQSSVHYTKTILPSIKFKVLVTNEEAKQILDTDWSASELCDLVSAFKKLSYYIMNNDVLVDKTKYDNIFDTLYTKIPNLDDELLEEILKCLIPFSKRSELDLKSIFQLLDKQCELRFKQWSIDKMFLMSDIFYCLGIHKDSSYIWKLMRKMNSKLNKLTPKHLVQLLFLVNASRKAELNMYEVEVRLEEQLQDLSIDELGIAAMGFFKSRTKIRNSLFLRAIINRLICEIEKVDSITLAALLKLIRYSMHYNEIVHFKMLLSNITPHVPKFDVMCLMHIGHACAKAGIYDKPLMDIIIERMYNDIKLARIKDIEKLAYVLSTFDIDDGHRIYDKIVEEVTERVNSSKMTEILNYPHILPNLLLYLSIKDIYPLHLIKLVMDPSYVERVCKGNAYNLSFGYAILEYSIRIDRPEYTGPFLKTGLLHTVTKLHWKSVASHTVNPITRMFNEVLYVLKGIITNDINPFIGKLMPNFGQNSIVIGIDENKNFISAEPILSQLCDFTIKRVNETFPKNVKWIVFFTIHYSHKLKGINKPMGMIKAKLRQLERIGYKPILITDDHWLSCKDIAEKKHYLRNLIDNS